MAKEVVSGMGKNSKRTDKNPSRQAKRYMAGGKYGEGKELLDLQSAAPIGGTTAGVSKPFSMLQEPVTPIFAETQRPEESPDYGMPFGDGPSPVDIGLMPGVAQKETPQKEDLRMLTNYIPMIEMAANAEGAPRSLSTFVKYLRSL
jgi:hypothetical protein